MTSAQPASEGNNSVRERRIWPAAIAVILLLVALPAAVVLASTIRTSSERHQQDHN
ncbi:exported hypothetical protein [Mesorhizobium sp. STM 4661]|nr:exported hypothetical protein [Mesorhizobium sp. STM 4661]